MADEKTGQTSSPAMDDTTCVWCDAGLTREGDCPECGRHQTRVCFCGEELLPDERRCASCGAEWTGVVKVRRRRRRHAHDWKTPAGYSALGVLMALLAAAWLYSYMDRLAKESAPNREVLESASISERWELARQTLQERHQRRTEALQERTSSVVLFAAFGLGGALVGVLVFLLRNGLPRVQPRDRESPGVRKRRRE